MIKSNEKMKLLQKHYRKDSNQHKARGVVVGSKMLWLELAPAQ